MLAGRIKLTTFVAGAAALGLVAIAGGYVACDKGPETVAQEPSAKTDSAAEPTPLMPKVAPRPSRPNIAQPASPPVARQVAVDGPSERPVDRAMMSWVGKNLGSKKKKDVTSGSAFKINVYQDAGEASANRAKVDLDRDGKWDEKWTFKPGEISRKVSLSDDENYGVKQVWKNGAWANQ